MFYPSVESLLTRDSSLDSNYTESPTMTRSYCTVDDGDISVTVDEWIIKPVMIIHLHEKNNDF